MFRSLNSGFCIAVSGSPQEAPFSPHSWLSVWGLNWALGAARCCWTGAQPGGRGTQGWPRTTWEAPATHLRLETLTDFRDDLVMLTAENMQWVCRGNEYQRPQQTQKMRKNVLFWVQRSCLTVTSQRLGHRCQSASLKQFHYIYLIPYTNFHLD